MNSIRKFFISIVIILLFLILSGNMVYIHSDNSGDRMYRVEAGRIVSELEHKKLSDINIKKYKSILFVEKYDAAKYCRQDYLVEEVNGTLYRIAYRSKSNGTLITIFNLSFAGLILVVIALYVYITTRLLKPFLKMSDYTTSLAKGNLSVPLKQEKNKIYSKFLWGLDMLRDNLEEKKERELAVQKEKKTLILSLSHDIKTPLSAIELYIKAIESGLYDSEEQQLSALSAIKKNTEEIKNYVNQITQASREDFLNLEVNNSELYLSELMDITIGYYKEKLSVIHTDFQVKKYTDCLVKGDKDRLVEVIQNVVENAIKYGDGSQLMITFEDEEDCKLIIISNTGNTLKEEELPNIFESFYRGSNAENVKGSGLGLFIGKTLMKLMDGDIFAKCDMNRFSVSIVLRKA